MPIALEHPEAAWARHPSSTHDANFCMVADRFPATEAGLEGRSALTARAAQIGRS
jgi:hypothetical protein